MAENTWVCLGLISPLLITGRFGPPSGFGPQISPIMWEIPDAAGFDL